jgi:CRP-like cAMP-binding protein
MPMGTLKFAPHSGATARTLTMRSAPGASSGRATMAAPTAPIVDSGPKPIAREWLTMNQPSTHRPASDSGGTRLEARRGEIFLNPGRGGEAIYQINRGHVALYKALPGRRSICVGLIGPNDVFTQEPGGHTGITAEALTDVSYVSYTMDQLVSTLSSSSDAARNVLSSLTRRLSETQILIERLLARDITLRLGGILLELAERFGKPAPDGMVAIDIPVPHKMLARMIGGNRVTVTRVMTDLRAEGLVASPGRNRVVISVDKLRAHVDRHDL